MTHVGNGYHKIVSKLNANRSWDVPNCDMGGEQALHLWDYYGTSCQLFKFNHITTLSSLQTSSLAMKKVEIEAPTVAFEVYPNPSTGGSFTVFLSSPQVEDYTIAISTTSGKCVYERQGLQNGQHYINSDLEQGMYILEVIGNGFKQNKKIIIR